MFVLLTLHPHTLVCTLPFSTVATQSTVHLKPQQTIKNKCKTIVNKTKQIYNHNKQYKKNKYTLNKTNHIKHEKFTSTTQQTPKINTLHSSPISLGLELVQPNLEVEALWLKGVLKVSWQALPINEDDRMLTGYFVYYKATEEAELDYMSGRDACNE